MDIQTNHHTQPHGGDVCRGICQQDRGHNRHNHNRDFNEIEEEAKDKDHQHNDDELHPEPTRQRHKEFTYQLFTTKGAEGCSQHGRTQQDHENQCRCFGGFHHHAVQRVLDFQRAISRPNNTDHDQGSTQCTDPDTLEIFGRCGGFDVHFIVGQGKGHDNHTCNCRKRWTKDKPVVPLKPIARHNQRTRGTNCACLVHCCDTRNDGSQNQEDQGKGWYKRQQNLAKEFAIICPLIRNRRGR